MKKLDLPKGELITNKNGDKVRIYFCERCGRDTLSRHKLCRKCNIIVSKEIEES